MRYFVNLPGRDEIAVDIVRQPDGGVEVAVEGEPVDVDAVDIDGVLSLLLDRKVHDLWSAADGALTRFTRGELRAAARVESERSRIAAAASRQGAAGGGSVTAPMPGRVVKVLVAEGDQLAAGTPVIVVEAMKMENELCCEQPGTVKKILASEGENVEGNAVLIELAPLDA